MKISETKETVNLSTGEVTEIQKTYKTKSKSENFFMVYEQGIQATLNGNSTVMGLLFYLCMRMDFESNKVLISTRERRELEEALNVSRQSVQVALKKLKEGNFIYGSREEYFINPYCFWKGTTDGRANFIKNNSKDLIKFNQ